MMSALIIACYGLRCASTLPYDDMNSNRLEVLLCAALFVQVSFASGAGLGVGNIDAGSALAGSASSWFLAISYSALVIPLFFLVLTMLLTLSCVTRRVPVVMRQLTDDELSQKVQSLSLCTGDRTMMLEFLQSLDRIELKALEQAMVTAAHAPRILRSSTMSEAAPAGMTHVLTGLTARRVSSLRSRVSSRISQAFASASQPERVAASTDASQPPQITFGSVSLPVQGVDPFADMAHETGKQDVASEESTKAKEPTEAVMGEDDLRLVACCEADESAKAEEEIEDEKQGATQVAPPDNDFTMISAEHGNDTSISAELDPRLTGADTAPCRDSSPDVPRTIGQGLVHLNAIRL